MFLMKTGTGKDDVSPPMYIAKGKMVKRLASSTDSSVGRKTPARRLVSWEYFQPKLWTNKVWRANAQGKALDENCWALDKMHPQDDQ